MTQPRPSIRPRDYEVTVAFWDDGQVMVETFVEGRGDPIRSEVGYDLSRLLADAGDAMIADRNAATR